MSTAFAPALGIDPKLTDCEPELAGSSYSYSAFEAYWLSSKNSRTCGANPGVPGSSNEAFPLNGVGIGQPTSPGNVTLAPVEFWLFELMSVRAATWTGTARSYWMDTCSWMRTPCASTESEWLGT